MYILIALFVGFVWFLWLAVSFRADYKKIILLLAGAIFEITGIYLIIQEGVKADEQGTAGNIFGNPYALLLLGLGLLIYIALTIQRLSKGKTADSLK